MLSAVSNLVYCPKGCVPSSVRLERYKEYFDFRRQMLASPFDVVRQVGRISREGEFGGAGIAPDVESSDLKSHLIKDRSEIVGEVENDARKIAKEFLIKFDLVGFCKSIGVFFDDVGPVILSGDLNKFGAEIVEVMFCPI